MQNLKILFNLLFPNILFLTIQFIPIPWTIIHINKLANNYIVKQ